MCNKHTNKEVMASMDGTSCTKTSARDKQLELPAPYRAAGRSCTATKNTSSICRELLPRPDWFVKKNVVEPPYPDNGKDDDQTYVCYE